MAGYRPIGLSAAAGSTIIAGRATSYADRRRAAAERLSKTADITQRLDAAVTVPAATSAAADVASGTRPIDPDGTLRASIRALIPVAHRTEGFDVTVSLGPSHQWAARIRRGPDGVTADLVPGPARLLGAPRPGVETGLSEAEIVAELAALLWNGEVGIR